MKGSLRQLHKRKRSTKVLERHLRVADTEQLPQLQDQDCSLAILFYLFIYFLNSSIG